MPTRITIHVTVEDQDDAWRQFSSQGSVVRDDAESLKKVGSQFCNEVVDDCLAKFKKYPRSAPDQRGRGGD